MADGGLVPLFGEWGMGYCRGYQVGLDDDWKLMVSIHASE